MTPQQTMENIELISTAMLYAGALLIVYFIPTINAIRRHHHNKVAIFMLNLFLGWSVGGWLWAFIWSWTRPSVVIVQR